MKRLEIPTFLCGTGSEVRRRSRKFLKTATKDGLSDTLAKQTFTLLTDAPGEIVLEKPAAHVQLEHVHLFYLGDELSKLTYSEDRNTWYKTNRDFIWKLFDEFWFCLALLGADPYILPIKTPFDLQRPSDCQVILSKLLRWWPEFCSCQERFVDADLNSKSPYQWASITWGLLRGMGLEHHISELREMDAEEIGESLANISSNLCRRQ